MGNVGSWQRAATLFAHVLSHYINIHISGQEQLAPGFLSFLLNVKASPVRCIIFKGAGNNPTELGKRGKSGLCITSTCDLMLALSW